MCFSCCWRKVLLLLLVDFAMCALLDLFTETEQLNLAVENTQQGVGALHKVVFEQQKGFSSVSIERFVAMKFVKTPDC